MFLSFLPERGPGVSLRVWSRRFSQTERAVRVPVVSHGERTVCVPVVSHRERTVRVPVVSHRKLCVFLSFLTERAS